MKFKIPGPYRKELAAAAFIMIVGNALGISLLYMEQREAKVTYLERNPFGEGDYEEILNVKTGEKEEKIKILIEEQKYTKEQTEQYFEDAKKELDSWFLKIRNRDGHLAGDVVFLEKIKNNPVQLSWNTNRPEILDWEGNAGDKIKKDGEEVNLMCLISIGEEVETWEKMIRIYPAKAGASEKLQQDIRKETEKINKVSEEKVYLPETIHGENLIFEKEKTHTGFAVCLCSLALGFGVLPLKKEKEKQQKEQRMREMQMDYPDIIEKLILFLKAGFSIRKSVEKLASNYMRNREKYHMKKRYAYEEIVCACREMDGGIYEAEAYERLGRRCVLPEYKVLSVLLVQNLRKGNQSILELLEREAVSAGDERRRRAKVRGDEASTKLLLPMILQLIVVLIILMVPAFLSFI